MKKIYAKDNDVIIKIQPTENDVKHMVALRKCIYCNKEFEISRARRNNKYCSFTCSSKKLRKQIFDDIEAGTYSFKSNRQYKSYLIKKNGHKCEMCGLNEWGSKPILLLLDHIDGNSDNFKLDNLRVICSNCDTLTPTYKNRNKGNGRYSRRKRYAEGKSF